MQPAICDRKWQRSARRPSTAAVGRCPFDASRACCASVISRPGIRPGTGRCLWLKIWVNTGLSPKVRGDDHSEYMEMKVMFQSPPTRYMYRHINYYKLKQ